MATVARQNMGDATGVTSLVRNLGGSVGISLITALVTRGMQAHQNLLVGHMTPYDAPFTNQLTAMQHSLAAQGADPVSAQHEAYGMMYQVLQQQAGLWAYVDQFRMLVIACGLLVPVVFLFKKASRPPPKEMAGAH
jgi:MFS transporter, DHA2 family, multidrug resistance protein